MSMMDADAQFDSLSNEMEYMNDLPDEDSIANSYNEKNMVNYNYVEESDGTSFTDYESLISNVKKQRATMKALKLSDKGYHKVVDFTKDKDTGCYKKFSVEFYETSLVPGSLIRNAVTGIRDAKARVGTADEDLFFKVCYSVGSVDKREPSILFYDTPEQWETHFKMTCNPKHKEKWQAKYYAACRLMDE
jgi:hypothetical protein